MDQDGNDLAMADPGPPHRIDETSSYYTSVIIKNCLNLNKHQTQYSWCGNSQTKDIQP
jgi:hypothetical protein